MTDVYAEERRNRELRMKQAKRDNEIFAEIYADQQMRLGNTSISFPSIVEEPKIITRTNEKFIDFDTAKNEVKSILSKYTESKEDVEKIVNDLELEELNYFIKNRGDVIQDIKKKNVVITPEDFTKLIRGRVLKVVEQELRGDYAKKEFEKQVERQKDEAENVLPVDIEDIPQYLIPFLNPETQLFDSLSRILSSNETKTRFDSINAENLRDLIKYLARDGGLPNTNLMYDVDDSGKFRTKRLKGEVLYTYNPNTKKQLRALATDEYNNYLSKLDTEDAKKTIGITDPSRAIKLMINRNNINTKLLLEQSDDAFAHLSKTQLVKVYNHLIDEGLMKARSGNIRDRIMFSTKLSPQKLTTLILQTKNFQGEGLPRHKTVGRGIINHTQMYSSNQISNTSKYPLIHGRGFVSVQTQTQTQPQAQVETRPLYKKNRKYFDKVYIDMDKLKSNILFCKYIKNNTNIPRLKTQTIDNDTKDVITDIISDRFNIKVYNQLNDHNKQVVSNFVRYFKYDIGVDNSNENNEFNKQFQILIGSYYAGNDSPEVKNQLKRYIRKAMSESLITTKEGLNLLYELN